MRILLVDPAPRSGITEPYEHLGLSSLCAVLRAKGYEVDILSGPLMNSTTRRMVKEIIRYNSDILGFSVKEVHARRTLRMVKALRQNGLKSHITMGGHFPTFNHIGILQDYPEVNSIVRGEGEDTMAELVEKVAGGGSLSSVCGLTWREGNSICDNPPRPLIEDLDRLLFLSRDMTQQVIHQGGAIGMIASRGCYANCSFCSIRSFYGTSPGQKWRTRSPVHIVDEIETLASTFPGAPFKFFDDQFIGPGERGRAYAFDIASEIQKRGISIEFLISCRVDAIEKDPFTSLKEAGLKKVFLGVESGTQQVLDRFDKNTTVEQNKKALQILDEIGIDYTIAFIFFDPYSTMEDVKGNLEFLSEIRPYWQGKKGVLSIEPSVTVHKGTSIEQRLRADGRLIGDYLGYRYKITDRKVQFLRAIADCLIRRIQPAIHQFRIKGRFQSKKIKEDFMIFTSSLKNILRGEKYIMNLKKQSNSL